MGYDLNRFEEQVDEELICSICSGVLEDPLQVSHRFVVNRIILFFLLVYPCNA